MLITIQNGWNEMLASLRDAHYKGLFTGGALRDHRLMAGKPPAFYQNIPDN
jgi:hypothetical protein